MEKKIISGVLLLISGLALSAVSIWMLTDTTQIHGIALGTTDSPKVGIAGGVLAIVVGIACCIINDIGKIKIPMIVAIIVLLALAAAAFGVALKERLDIKKFEDIWALASQLRDQQRGGARVQYTMTLKSPFGNQKSGSGGQQNLSGFEAVFTWFDKMKPQLTALMVVGALAMIFEIISLIVVFRTQPRQSSSNDTPMVKPY